MLLSQEFYEATVKHRRLQWYYHHGYATLRGNFRSKAIDIFTSTTQAAVLLLFNAGACPQTCPCVLIYAPELAVMHYFACGTEMR